MPKEQGEGEGGANKAKVDVQMVGRRWERRKKLGEN